jgi:hypothetical protein
MNFKDLAEEYIQVWPRAKKLGVSPEQFVRGSLDDISDRGASSATVGWTELLLRKKIRELEQDGAERS